MTAGVGLFGTFTAYVASYFLQSNEKDEDVSNMTILTELAEIKERLEQIERRK